MTGGGISCLLSPQPLHVPQAKSTRPISSGTTSPGNWANSAHKCALEEKNPYDPTYGDQSLPSLDICHFIPGFKKPLVYQKAFIFPNCTSLFKATSSSTSRPYCIQVLGLTHLQCQNAADTGQYR